MLLVGMLYRARRQANWVYCQQVEGRLDDETPADAVTANVLDSSLTFLNSLYERDLRLLDLDPARLRGWKGFPR